MSSYLVSIVIPTFNHLEDCLRPCIESILKYTTMSNIEIIVVANGCTDDTCVYMHEMESTYPDIFQLIWMEDAVGFTIATNMGIKRAKGEYIILLNNDTVILDFAAKDEWIQRLLAPFSDPKVMITGPLILKDFYSNVNFIVFFCACIRARMFDELGLLDEVYVPGGGEDIDFAWKIQNAGYSIAAVQESTYNGTTNTGNFPMWHKDNRTFREIPEYTRSIIKRNGLRNLQKYNKSLKLNVGAGGIDLHGYVSVDLYDQRAHIIYDITRLSEIIPAGITEEILALHVFEHLNPYKALEVLKGWFALLKPGGKLCMEMPDIEVLCRRFGTASTGERYGILNAIYGSVNTVDPLDTPNLDPSKITSPHLFGWWPQSIGDLLFNAGFVNITILPEQHPHPESNFRVEATKLL